jgi:hypothetical protein
VEKKTVFFSHTYQRQYFVQWKGGVEIDGLGRFICMPLDQRQISCTHTGANSIAWWKGRVEKNGVIFVQLEPVFCMVEGEVDIDGLGRCNCMLLDQRQISCTSTRANSIAWSKGRVEKNGVLFAHVPEPMLSMAEGRGGKERCSFHKHTRTKVFA